MIPKEDVMLNRLGPFSAKYFREEICRFRDVMCSTAYTAEQKQRAFGGLFLVYVNVDTKEPPKTQEECRVAWEGTAEEYARRQTMEIMRPIGKGLRR